jgi:hypothetical protein
MLRYKDATIAAKASEIGVKLANSNLVGYDQGQRNTLYAELKKNNFDVDKYIKSGVKTETDCSAFQYAIYCCLIPAMRQDGNAPTTSTMKSFFTKYGFTAYTDSKYLTSDSYLLKGDVLVAEGKHTVQNITTGLKISTYTQTQFIKDVQTILGMTSNGKATTALLNKTITVSRTINNKHDIVKPIQKYLNLLGYSCGEVDGSFGAKTEAALKQYQSKIVGLKAPDGVITKCKGTWKKLLGLA